MPTQKIDSGDYTWVGNNNCPKCGKPKYIVGDFFDSSTVCHCPPKRYGDNEYTYHYDFTSKVYLGKIAGIPVYVNSEKDRDELSIILKSMNIYIGFKEE